MRVNQRHLFKKYVGIRISGLVVEYIVAIDVTRVRFPADARFWEAGRDAGAASRAKGRRRGQQASLV